MDLKVFVDTDADERLARRLRRDIAERGRDLKDILEQYNRFVKPAYNQFIAPSMAQADIIIPRGELFDPPHSIKLIFSFFSVKLMLSST
ncbi:unnamed protein product [Protopolystoma xenopodis]|uniref:Phosphoribulokinase/uridine kinase domain-containing protein n=1 Tax=Protopolystoma xenopodis TaxID=117903 RepID=A0A3S5AY45_9PLAT|nr:unnamed protein product [Protopolystoma xenopodis]